MKEFIDQFALSPYLSSYMEGMIGALASRLVDDYTGGAWTSTEVSGTRILLLPKKGNKFTLKSNKGPVPTDHLTASLAFTKLLVEWCTSKFSAKLDQEKQQSLANYSATLDTLSSSPNINTVDYSDIVGA